MEQRDNISLCNKTDRPSNYLNLQMDITQYYEADMHHNGTTQHTDTHCWTQRTRDPNTDTDQSGQSWRWVERVGQATCSSSSLVGREVITVRRKNHPTCLYPLPPVSA